MSPGVLSPWVVMPVAGALLLLVGAVQIRIQRSDAPPSRKRIRAVNGWIMLLAIPFLAAGFSLINPSLDPRAFLLTWIAGLGLLCISVFFAILDMLNTWRLTSSSRRSLGQTYDMLNAVSRVRPRANTERDAPQEPTDAS